jgi:hypothetical protein
MQDFWFRGYGNKKIRVLSVVRKNPVVTSENQTVDCRRNNRWRKTKVQSNNHLAGLEDPGCFSKNFGFFLSLSNPIVHQFS